MRPRLLCGLALCAGLAGIASARAPEAQPSKTETDPGRAPETRAVRPQGFRDGVATILAKEPTGGRAWSDIDRDRLLDGFRLTGQLRDPRRAGPLATASADRLPIYSGAPMSSVAVPTSRDLSDNLASALTINAGGTQRRHVTLGLDSAALGPAGNADTSPARASDQHMADVGSCSGLMPAFACGSDGHSANDSLVSLALAYNF